MKCKINVTSKAESDLIEAVEYIKSTLLNPQAAVDLIDEFEKETSKLSSMPERHKLVDDYILASWGIRMIIVKNYIVFYSVDKETKTVTIRRFLYGKRNWIAVLSGRDNSVDWTVVAEKDNSKQN